MGYKSFNDNINNFTAMLNNYNIIINIIIVYFHYYNR